MKKPSVYKTHAEAMAAGWFSRRHQTSDALEESRASREEKKRLSAERINKKNSHDTQS
jgi:hypothetical protein